MFVLVLLFLFKASQQRSWMWDNWWGSFPYILYLRSYAIVFLMKILILQKFLFVFAFVFISLISSLECEMSDEGEMRGVRLFARRTFTTPKIRTFTTPKFGHFPPPKTKHLPGGQLPPPIFFFFFNRGLPSWSSQKLIFAGSQFFLTHLTVCEIQWNAWYWSCFTLEETYFIGPRPGPCC